MWTRAWASAVATVASAIAVSLTAAPRLAADDALTATLATGGQEWVSRRYPIEIQPNRPVTASEGRLAVLLGKTDLTDLFEAAGAGLRYRGALRPLPSGAQELIVFLVTPANEWREVARLPFKVLNAGGLERAAVVPKLDLTLKGQIAEGHFPESAAPERATFQDLTGQANVTAELGKGSLALAAQMTVALANRREDALRFGEKGQEADRADLSSYGVKFTAGSGSFEWGNVSFGENRHLINAFSSRGGKASLALGKVVDVAVAAENGSAIVGWDNFFGLDNAEHQVFAGRLGLEIVPSAPGTVRIETTLVDGSLQPRNSFNRGFVSDAEKSQGLGVRALANLFAGRLRLEGGFARSHFESPPDPTLDKGLNVVPIAPTTRSAEFANAALDVVKGAGPFSLTVAFRHERVDPQYRSVAVSTQADLQQDAVELSTAAGPVTLQAGFAWTVDNLADLPGLLTTKTRKPTLAAAVPLGPLLGGATPAWWIPALTYSVNATRQFGANRPLGGGFNETQIPDQVAEGQTAGAEWQAGAVHWGWRLSYSSTDNRQPGRELADTFDVANTALVGLPVTPFLDFFAELGSERAVSKEPGIVDRTKRAAAVIGLKPFTNAVLSANGSRTETRDDAGTKASLNWIVNVEAAWRFEPKERGAHGITGQLALRYGWVTQRIQDFVQGLDSYRKTWTVGSGVSLNFF